MKDMTARTQLRDLEDQHRSLDMELRELARRAYLTPSEQNRAATLKKEKLSAKDRIQAIRRNLNG